MTKREELLRKVIAELNDMTEEHLDRLVELLRQEEQTNTERQREGA